VLDICYIAALPLIEFQIMNLVNGLTGYSGFQLLMGRSPRLIPPFLATTNADHSTESDRAAELIKRIKWDVEDAKDHLLEAKCMQAFYTNRDRDEACSRLETRSCYPPYIVAENSLQMIHNV